MQHLIISALAGLAGYSFVMLAGFGLKGKPLNCQVCMAFWFGLIISLLVEPSFYAPAVGFGAMWFAAMAQKTLLK